MVAKWLTGSFMAWDFLLFLTDSMPNSKREREI